MIRYTVGLLLYAAGAVHAAAHNEEFAKRLEKERRQILETIVTFPFSSTYLTLTDGSSFNYTQIGGDADLSVPRGAGGVVVRIDEHDGMLRSFNDGKQVRLVLGSMPRTAECIAELREKFNLSKRARIAVHSMNLPFECGWGGVSSVVEHDATLTLFNYPTVDEYAPAFIDTIRLMQRLDDRDSEPYELHYLHCLAGRGRSATMAVIYIMSCLNKAKIPFSADQVIAYLKNIRPQVNMSGDQMQLVRQMYSYFSSADIDAMCKENADALERRQAGCSYAVMAPQMSSHAQLYNGVKKGCLALSLLAYAIYLGVTQPAA